MEIFALGSGEPIYREFSQHLLPWALRYSVLRMPSAEAAIWLDRQGQRLDFVFIDAAHDYDGCAADIEAYRPLLIPGGLLAGHDYSNNFPGVVQAVNELVGPIARVGDIWWTTGR